MTGTPIHFDTSPASVVILCDLCPHWRALRLSMDHARECAAEHERVIHPDIPDVHQYRRRVRRAMTRRRAADTDEMRPVVNGKR